MGGPTRLPGPLLEFWDELRAEMERKAEEYRKEDWETHTFTVGEVRPVASSNKNASVPGPGLRILVPDNHYDVIADLLEKDDEYSCEIYKQSVGQEAVLLLTVFLFNRPRVAVMVPMFYLVEDAESMIEQANEERRFITQFRPLDRRGVVSLEHDDPTLFLPAEEQIS